MSALPVRRAQLPEAVHALLVAIFGVATALLIRWLDAPGLPRPDLLGLAAGSAGLITALVWFFALGVRRSALWGVSFLIPYVNLIAASYYARRYWSEDARGPAVLALAAIAIQTLAALRLLAPPLPVLV